MLSAQFFHNLFQSLIINYWPVPVAARSKAYVCGRSPAEVLDSNHNRCMDVCLLWVLVLPGRGPYDDPITPPEEPYRLWCVVVCDLETSRIRRPNPRRATAPKKFTY